MKIELALADAEVERLAQTFAQALAHELTAVRPPPPTPSETPLEGGEPVLMTITEAAEFLRVGKTTVYEVIRKGDLSPTAVASRKLIRRSDLYSYVSLT